MCGIIGIMAKTLNRSNWIKITSVKSYIEDQTVMDFGIQRINLCLLDIQGFR